MTDAEMWGILADVATMLDVPDCDWRTLQQAEEMLSSLSTELERESPVEAAQAQNGYPWRHSDADLRMLRRSLAWVRRHEYVALEAELQEQLGTALRHVLATLDRSERWQLGPVRSS